MSHNRAAGVWRKRKQAGRTEKYGVVIEWPRRRYRARFRGETEGPDRQ